jgi:hypothetical protein
MSSGRSKLDQTQILQSVYDPENDALRSVLTGTSFAIELDAEDGDSVISKKKTDIIELTLPKTVIDLSMVEKVCLYGCDTALLKILVDNQEVHCYTLTKGNIIEIMAKRVEIDLLDATHALLMVK